jgi:hypothetical protein
MKKLSHIGGGKSYKKYSKKNNDKNNMLLSSPVRMEELEIF